MTVLTPVAFLTQNSYPAAGVGGVTSQVLVHSQYSRGAAKLCVVPVPNVVAGISAATAAANPPPVAPLSRTAPTPDVSVRVLPSAIVSVAEVAGAVSATLLTEVAV